MSYFHQQIGERIKTLREAKGYTQQELSIMLDVDVELIDKFETGSMRLFVEHVSKLAILFNVSTDYLIYGVEKK